jgi:hypothetical protein
MMNQSSISLAPYTNGQHSMMGTAFLAAATQTGGYQSILGAALIATAGFAVVAQTVIFDRRSANSATPRLKAVVLAEHSAWTDWTSFVISSSRASDPIIAEVQAYRDLCEGWDGENAAAPNEASIKDACDFAQRLGMSADLIAATLDVDGSVIFEIDENRGSIMFLGDRNIVYALRNGQRGRAHFDGFKIPSEIMTAISS